MPSGFFGKERGRLKDIPLQEQSPLLDILTPETTVFSLFIPLTQISEDLCPIPRDFLSNLKGQSQFFREKGMRYFFATDSGAMTEEQYSRLQAMLTAQGIEVFDVSQLPNYLPYEPWNRNYRNQCAFDSYFDRARYPTAEYIDKAKVMLANLAGTEGWRNILITDFDVDIETLEILPTDKIAFTYTGRHTRPTSGFDTENSMIYVSQERPLNARGEDLISHVLQRIHDILDRESHKTLAKKYGSFAYSTLCHDPIVENNIATLPEAIEQYKQNVLEKNREKIRSQYESNPEKINEEIERTERALIMSLDDQCSDFLDQTQILYPVGGKNIAANEIREILERITTQTGHFLLHGNYSSDNKSTWKDPDYLPFIPFDEAQELLVGGFTESPGLAR